MDAEDEMGGDGTGGDGTGGAERLVPDRDIAVDRQREAMVRALFAAVDGEDVDTLVTFFSPEARQRFGNRPWMQGRREIRAAYLAFKSVVRDMHNEITGLWESAGTVIVRMAFHCARLDGSVVDVQTVCMFGEGPDGLIDSFQIWSDWTPLLPVVPPEVIRQR